MSKVFDVLGIGFGPANIAVAALLNETSHFKNHIFLEREQSPGWQSEMLFENALDIHSNVQNVPHRDLATLRSPRSRFTFMNYLHENGLLMEHLNMDLLMPMRPDYAAYIKWVSDELSDKVRSNVSVRSVDLVDNKGTYVYRVETDNQGVYFARHLIIGTGRPPLIPPLFENILQSERIFHLNQYSTRSKALLETGAKKFAVIGSSQSAVEIILHLSKIEPRLEIHSIFRRFGYPLKDTSPFMSEIYFPEFTDLYYNADKATKSLIDRDVLRTNYGSCDMDVLEELYRQIYYDKMNGKNGIELHRMSSIEEVKEVRDGVEVIIRNAETKSVRAEKYDGVILATGFRNIGPDKSDIRIPSLLLKMERQLELNGEGYIDINREYLAKYKPGILAGGLVLNGLCEVSHGMGDAGSLSLLSLRAKTIVDALLVKDKGIDRLGKMDVNENESCLADVI